MPNKFSLKDIISIADFKKQDILYVLDKSKKFEKTPKKKKEKLLKNITIASLFFEPSTRTRLSFESAAKNLGAEVIGFDNPDCSAIKKGESFSDSIKVISNYVDIIIIRHYIEGAPRRAAEITNIPIINAGDGSNQHPTQTLVDLYTLQKTFGKISDLNIGFLGDLKYGRTVHSLAFALTMFNNITVYLISPEMLRFPNYIKDEIKDNLNIIEGTEINKYINELDILYCTRIQKERFADLTEYEKVKGSYIIDLDLLKDVKDNFKIMHPLPRVDEIAIAVDDTKYNLYFEQAANGIPVREALLTILKGVNK